MPESIVVSSPDSLNAHRPQITCTTMPDSVIEYDYPPPIKPQKIRLVLPEEDELSNIEDVASSVQSGDAIKNNSLSDFTCHGFGEDPEIVSRVSEMNELELALIEREEIVKQTELHLAERERNLWEFEALILAREKLLDTQKKQLEKQKTTSTGGCEEEMQSLEQLRHEVERQQESLEATKKELKEREQFVEASEDRLLEKTMQQQEEESRLEQLKEDLEARELRVNEMEGKPPPPKVQKEVL